MTSPRRAPRPRLVRPVALLTALTAACLVAPAPAARAADFFGTGGGDCPAALAARGDTLGFLTRTRSGHGYQADINLGRQAVSAARLHAPRATWRPVPEVALSSWAGYMVLDRAGRAWFVRQADGGALYSRTLIRGPWRGLRALLPAAATGRPDDPATRADLLYGITTDGRLVRMPISWNAKGVPGVGPRQVVGRGINSYRGLVLSGYLHEADHVPTADRFTAITTTGAVRQIDVSRGRAPRVTTRTLATRGFSGARAVVTDQCWQTGRADAWFVQHRDGRITHHVDPDVGDASLRGATTTRLRGTLPAGVRLL